MWYVYVLRCVDGSLYVGMTNAIDRRLDEHRRGKVMWTKSRLPVELFHLRRGRVNIHAQRRGEIFGDLDG